MRLIGQDNLHSSDELTSFTARSSVQAIRCNEGAAVLDGNGDTLDSYDRPCYALVDGDDVQLVPAVIFDALYTEQRASSSSSSSTSSTPPASSTPADPQPTDVRLAPDAGTGNTPSAADTGTNPLTGTTDVTPLAPADVSTDIGPGAAYGQYAATQDTAGPTPGPEAPTPTVDPADSETTTPSDATDQGNAGSSSSASTA